MVTDQHMLPGITQLVDDVLRLVDGTPAANTLAEHPQHRLSTCLAIDRRDQGKGRGALLLRQALRKSVNAGEPAAARLLPASMNGPVSSARQNTRAGSTDG
jgi:hypothetical protein